VDGVPARDLALDVGARAAALLAGAQDDVGTVRHKGNLDTDWVTAWDERVERLIVDGLRAGAPGTTILGEEGGEAAGEPGRGRWLVDPIDGTVNFAHGLPVFGVSIGYEVGGQVQAGVVLAPALGWTFAAARGQGATMNGRRLAVSRVGHLRGAMLVTGFPADRLTNPDNNYREWAHFQDVAGAVRRFGAACLDLCMVARGWLDGYWEGRLHAWDLAAGSLIVEEAGGRISSLDGGPFLVDAGEIVATNGRIHDEVVAELASARAGNFSGAAAAYNDRHDG
jgi:myo-inositol-1(or 4)-monophosphatase